jgi:dCTP diphosphatase
VDLTTLRDTVTTFAHEREWEPFHDAKNLSMALASEAGELNAVLRWVRNEDLARALGENRTREALIDEIGDVGILLLLLCAELGVGLDQAVLDKLEQNARKYPVQQARGRADPPQRAVEE